MKSCQIYGVKRSFEILLQSEKHFTTETFLKTVNLVFYQRVLALED